MEKKTVAERQDNFSHFSVGGQGAGGWGGGKEVECDRVTRRRGGQKEIRPGKDRKGYTGTGSAQMTKPTAAEVCVRPFVH